MNLKTIIISIFIGILTFCLGWFLHDFKQLSNNVIADGIRVDSLRKVNQAPVMITQSQLDSLKVKANINDKRVNFATKLNGKFIMKGANNAGLNFISPTLVSWTNEIDWAYPDTLKLRWLDNVTFLTQDIKTVKENCPPRIWIYQVISFDGEHLFLNEIWTGWDNYKDKQTEFEKATN